MARDFTMLRSTVRDLNFVHHLFMAFVFNICRPQLTLKPQKEKRWVRKGVLLPVKPAMVISGD